DGIAHGTRGNEHTVDLNRNFPTDDWRKGKTTTRWETHLPRDVELTAGTSPASEPEISSLIKFIQDNQIEQIISLHAPLGCIDYEQKMPWSLIKVLSK